MNKKWLGVVAGVIIIAVAAWLLPGYLGPSTVTVETVGQKEMPLRVSSDANMSALNKATITPTLSAPVTDMRVKVGDDVQAGEVVAVLDSTALQTQLSSLMAQLEQARSSAGSTAPSAPRGADGVVIQKGAVTSENVEQAREMLNAGIITQKEFNTISSRASGGGEVFVAAPQSSGGGSVPTGNDNSAAIAGIQSAIAQVQSQIAQTQIIAPMSGKVSAIYNEDRKVSIAGRPFMMIQQITPVVASVSIPQTFAQSLAQMPDKKAAQVKVLVANTEVLGEITYIDTMAPAGTPSVLLKATFDNSAGKITPGEFYPLVIDSPITSKVTAVPSTAIHSNSDGKFVYVMTADNTVDVRVVETGDEVDGYTAITNGLSEGEQIITSKGKYDLGEKVKVAG